jgi:hypothetical protein
VTSLFLTCLSYLSTANDGDGGHTLFPCLPSQPNTIKGVKVAEQLSLDFAQLFDNGTRVIDDKVTGDDEIGLLKRCNSQCGMAHMSQVLSVQPVKGTAIVFWNVEADGNANQQVWHSACQALAGPHR